MKRQSIALITILVLFTSVFAINFAVVPILAKSCENEVASACPEEPVCPEQPACPEECPDEPVCPEECPEEPESCEEECEDVCVIMADSHMIFMGEGVSGTGPLRWEGTVTFSDGTEFT